MSETTTPHPADAPAFNAASLARLSSLARPGFEPKTFVKSVTPFEIGAIVLLLLLVAGVFALYSWYILPDQVRYVQLSNEVSANRAKIEELQKKVVDPSSVTARFEEVHASLEEFRGGVLKPARSGKQELQAAIGRTVAETGVRLASPVSYKMQEPLADAGAARDRRRSSDDSGEITSYPSMTVELSIAGSYAQVRSFISRFEGTDQFVVIEALTLNTEDEDEGGGQRGLITLDLEMTAYFQPDGLEPAGGAR
jgi:hypothetical protein